MFKKVLKIPASSKNEVREGLIGFVKDGIEEIIDTVTIRDLIKDENLERIGEWMKKNNVSYLKIGEFEVKRRIPENE